MNLTIQDQLLVALVSKAFEHKISQKVTAGYLSQLGYTSADGRVLSASHISNFERKHLKLRRTAEYTKPNYPMNYTIATRLQSKGLWDLKKKIEDSKILSNDDIYKIREAGESDQFLEISEHYRRLEIGELTDDAINL